MFSQNLNFAHARPTQDSYDLFLNNRSSPSRSWTVAESNFHLNAVPWLAAKLSGETLIEKLPQFTSKWAKKEGDFGVQR
jgi:hypothetical protein